MTHDERVYHHMYETNEGIAEHAERIASLEELVRWMYDCMDESCAVQHPYAPTPINYDQLMQAQARARELGIEVGYE